MAGSDFREMCTLGERADRLVRQRPAEAEAAYLELMRRVVESREFDVFLMSKIVLGLLLAKIERQDVDGARRILRSELDNMLLGVGLRGLEQGRTSEHDRVVYDFACAFVHSHEPDRKQATKAVQRTMLRVLEYARRAEPALEPMALRNWKLHLATIYDGRAPASAVKKFLAAERRYGRPIPSVPLRFPPPAPWIGGWTGPEGQGADPQGADDEHPSLLDRLKGRWRRS